MGSPFFARIKTDVLRITASIPKGALTTYASMGAHLDVVPRHIAYILSTLTSDELEQYPWWRVVGASGALGKSKFGTDNISQAEFLEAEGVTIAKNSVVCFAQLFVDSLNLNSGIAQQTRPADAPQGTRGK